MTALVSVYDLDNKIKELPENETDLISLIERYGSTLIYDSTDSSRYILDVYGYHGTPWDNIMDAIYQSSAGDTSKNRLYTLIVAISKTISVQGDPSILNDFKCKDPFDLLSYTIDKYNEYIEWMTSFKYLVRAHPLQSIKLVCTLRYEYRIETTMKNIVPNLLFKFKNGKIIITAFEVQRLLGPSGKNTISSGSLISDTSSSVSKLIEDFSDRTKISGKIPDSLKSI